MKAGHIGHLGRYFHKLFYIPAPVEKVCRKHCFPALRALLFPKRDIRRLAGSPVADERSRPAWDGTT